MSRRDLVSVIIPCYKQAHFLGDAIESALAQTHRDVEIVVVDDGSPDGVGEVASRYAAVRCVRQNNRGVAAARNTGAAVSTGGFLVFLDSDDRLLPRALEGELRCLKASTEAAFVYGHVRLIDTDGSPLEVPAQFAVHEHHYMVLLRHNYIWTPGAVMYRRSAFEDAGGFDARISAASDLDLNLKIARRFPALCHDEVVLEYRKHPDNMSDSSVAMLRASIIALRAQRRHIKGNFNQEAALNSHIQMVRDDYGEKSISLLTRLLRVPEPLKALKVLAALLRYYPHGVPRRIARKAHQLSARLRNSS